MTLAEFQDAFQRAILAGDDGLLAVEETARFSRKARIGVYIDAYRLRLAAVTASDYPMVRDILGEEAFEELVVSYVETTRSFRPNVRWYASDLPEFMANDPRWSRLRGEISLARFERALADAFDAADARAGTADDLSAFGIEAALRLRFELHPSVRMLDLESGTTLVYESLSAGEAPEAFGQGSEHALFWRRDGECFYRLVDEDERFALTLAQDGYLFGELCELLAFRDNGDDVDRRAAVFLSRWLADGLVSAITLAE